MTKSADRWSFSFIVSGSPVTLPVNKRTTVKPQINGHSPVTLPVNKRITVKSVLLTIVPLLRTLGYDELTRSRVGPVYPKIMVYRITVRPLIYDRCFGRPVSLLVASRATYVVDGQFFAHSFWKVEGTVRTHINSHVAHMWLWYTVINM